MLTGLAIALGASLCWALANVAIQRTGRAMGAIRALLWAQIAVVPFFALLSVLWERPSVQPLRSTVFWIAVAGISALIAYVPLFDALQRGSLAVVVPIASSWSVLSTAMEIACGAPLRVAHGIGTLLVLLGIVFVARPTVPATAAPCATSPGATRADARLAVIEAAVAAAAFGVMVPALHRLTPRLGSMGAITASYVVDLLLGVPLALVARKNLAPPPAKLWPWVIATGALETAGYVCVNIAGRFTPLSQVGPAASLSPAFTVAYGWAVLAERPGKAALLGGVIASAGLVLLGS